jgi:hypothetical protein
MWFSHEESGDWGAAGYEAAEGGNITGTTLVEKWPGQVYSGEALWL